MIKSYSITATGIFLLGLFVCSCTNKSGTSMTNEFHLLKLDTMLTEYNAPRESKDKSAITKGNANIIVKDNMISIEHTADGGDEYITYFLQTRNKDYDLKTDSLGRVEVLFLGRNLIINSLEAKKTFLFSVLDNTIPPYMRNLTGVKRYTGYGLGVRKIKKDGSPDNVPFCSCEQNGTPDANCNRGGEGAHGCGTGTPDGSCEVSCSESAFACCDKKKE